MRRITLISFIIFLFVSACTENAETPQGGSLLLLEIDYTTYEFKGGKEYMYSSAIAADTVPVKTIVKPPCDYGFLIVRYERTKDTIFCGTVCYNSNAGEIEIPKAFDPVNRFAPALNPVNVIPSKSQFQLIHIDELLVPNSFTPIWNAICNLEKINTYYDPNKKIGIFLYTPGIYGNDGVNKHKEEWRWFVLMYK